MLQIRPILFSHGLQNFILFFESCFAAGLFVRANDTPFKILNGLGIFSKSLFDSITNFRKPHKEDNSHKLKS